MNFIKRQPPGRLIAAGFALVILAGAALLMLPVSVRDGAQVTPIDALFTSTSAVCVTGLIAIDTADHFTVFGRTIVALLIQVGGLGVTSVGVGFILVAGKRVGFKSRLLVREAMNMENGKGIVRLVKSILLMTLCFEGAGALLSFLVFVQDHPPVEAIYLSHPALFGVSPISQPARVAITVSPPASTAAGIDNAVPRRKRRLPRGKYRIALCRCVGVSPERPKQIDNQSIRH